jgi:hypothetical protein
MHTVYYLTHVETQQRIKWYQTQTGARIAQTNRNRRLGFPQPYTQQTINNHEYQLDTNGFTCTYYIAEDTIDSPDLLESL